jgi:type II secretory pathway pseudopilin PulG
MTMTRRGMTLIELTVAGVIIGTVLVVGLQMLTVVAAQRRGVDQQQLATLELANVMERVAVRPWSELTPQAAAEETLSPAIRSQLSNAELKVDVSTSDAEPDAKRIVASLRWQGRAGVMLPPLTITTWKYRPQN